MENKLDLSVEQLDALEAPVSWTDVAIAFGVGVAVGVIIAT